MEPVAIVARSTDGFILSLSGVYPTDHVKQARLILRNTHLLKPQITLECGTVCYHFQKGSVISVMLITANIYSTMEAYSRIAQIHDDYMATYSCTKINETSTTIISGNDELTLSLQTQFDPKNAFSTGVVPLREHIAPVLSQIKGQPLGFSSKALKKKATVELSWKEILLLVPLTLIAFLKTLVAFRIGGLLHISTNMVSTVVAFYLVFICVHNFLTTKRLILSSLSLLVLTYGTTMESLISVSFNGIFALLTLANVAHYYLKPSDRLEQV